MHSDIKCYPDFTLMLTSVESLGYNKRYFSFCVGGPQDHSDLWWFMRKSQRNPLRFIIMSNIYWAKMIKEINKKERYGDWCLEEIKESSREFLLYEITQGSMSWHWIMTSEECLLAKFIRAQCPYANMYTCLFNFYWGPASLPLSSSAKFSGSQKQSSYPT